MKGRFVERIGGIAHRKSSTSEINKALKAQPLLKEKLLSKDSVVNGNLVLEKTAVKRIRNKNLFFKKIEVVKDSANNKEIKGEPHAKRKYKRVLRGFAWVAAGATIVTIIFVLLSIFTKIYLVGFIWYLAVIALASTFYLSIGGLFILLFIYVFLKQTKKFRGEAEEKKGYTKVKWEYIFLLFLQLLCLPFAAFGSVAIVPSVIMALISVLYYHKERKLTKETDFFNYKRTKMFMIFVGIILMLSFVLAFGVIF